MLAEQKKKPIMPMLGNMMMGMRPALGLGGPPMMGAPLALIDATAAPAAPVPEGAGVPGSGLNSLGYPLRPGVMACTYFAKMGTCKFASQCKWDHPEKFVGTHTKASMRALMAQRGVIMGGPPGAGGVSGLPRAPLPSMLALPPAMDMTPAGSLLGLGGPPPGSSPMRPPRPIGLPAMEHRPMGPPPSMPNTPIGQRLPPPGGQTTLL